MVRNKKKAVKTKETAKTSWPSIRNFFPVVTPARWQSQIAQTALEPAIPTLHPSSDDFDASQDFLAHLGDVDMAEVSDPTIKHEPDEAQANRAIMDKPGHINDSGVPSTISLPSDNQDWDMGAESTGDYPNLNVTDMLFVQEPDRVRLPSPAFPNRKRPLPQPTMPPLSQKVSRESETHQSARLYNVNALFPVRSEMSRSFDSNTSTTSSFVSASTTGTTPNTSFNTETSFTPVPSSVAAVKGDPRIFAGPSHPGDQAEMLVDYESEVALGFAEQMEVDKESLEGKTTLFSPVILTHDHEAPRAPGADRHLANLFSTGPFGESSTL